MRGPFMSLALNLRPSVFICKVRIMVPGLLRSQRCSGTSGVCDSLGHPYSDPSQGLERIQLLYVMAFLSPFHSKALLGP